MVGVQYVTAPRATQVQRRLEEVNSTNDTTFIENTINDVIQAPVKKQLDQNIKPSKHFMEAYNKRVKVEEKEHETKQFLQNIDDEGYKIEKVYDHVDFKQTHDPLNVHRSKGSYKDLCWKVFSDCDEKHVFLKTLYYPELRTEDYNTLITDFSAEHKRLPLLKKLNFFGSFTAASLGFYVSNNHFKFTMRSTLVSSALIFGLGWYSFNQNSIDIINSNLNVKALEIARKYPEIKTANVTYERINV